MAEGEPNPRQTLALLLGASEFPYAPKLAQGRAFYNSAQDFREYLMAADGLALPAENVRWWFFDDSRSPSDQLQGVRDFLEKRSNDLKVKGTPAQDLIVFYIGHGLFSGPDYCLAVRGTVEGSEGFTSIRARDLASALRDQARFLRKFLIFDCCFSAQAYKEFQSAPMTVGRRKLLEELPRRGTTLLCSSSAQDVSIAPEGHSRTMFSESMLRALRQGDPRLGAKLSLNELGDMVRLDIRETYKDSGVRPEVHSPDQREGDIAGLALFPNAAWARGGADEMRRREEAEARDRELAERRAREAEEIALRVEAQRREEVEARRREEAAASEREAAERRARETLEEARWVEAQRRWAEARRREESAVSEPEGALEAERQVQSLTRNAEAEGPPHDWRTANRAEMTATHDAAASAPTASVPTAPNAPRSGYRYRLTMLVIVSAAALLVVVSVRRFFAPKPEPEQAPVQVFSPQSSPETQVQKVSEPPTETASGVETDKEVSSPIVRAPVRPATLPANAKGNTSASTETASQHIAAGNALWPTGNWDGAAAEYAAAIQIDPNSASAHHNLGIALGHKEDWDRDIKEQDEAIRLNPSDAQAHCERGSALGHKGDWDGDIKEQDEAIRLDPYYAWAHNELGAAFAYKGNWDGEIKEEREAIRLDPNSGWAHDHLGFAMEQKGLLSDAQAEYAKAVSLEPTNSGFKDNLARVQKRSKP